MPNRDVSLELDPKVTVAPQSVGGVVTGTTVDLFGCDSALVLLNAGAATAAATIKIEEAPDNAGVPGAWTAVADTDLIGLVGNPAGFATTASTIKKVGYVGAQRFVRVSTTTGTAALFSAEVVRAHLRHAGPQPV